ncbi:cysteine--tRNA ligase [Lentibacillus saliphilus]|uniref:cysteine--tRNA ligase n=1 Tax=Lentibacillus saliphilus TaxID=2737028 RepID=UPI001C2F1FD4|nr:cysteine--tRNA ligase [Lentibacillus saliphilus]
MSITIYSTLTHEKEVFQPIEAGKVKMYVCGPTVYNYIHIGNARPAVVFDTVRRFLEYKGYTVDYVLNFTDVDDKIIKTANELGEAVSEVTDRFIEAYLEDVKALGVKQATFNPRVTETMDDIIAFVEGLINKGFAYEADGDVYFKPRAFDGYGKLSHQSIDELRSGARIQIGEKKEDPLDFALWKEAKDGEISWDSPWGKGRPGWHIECSAMAKKYLGPTIDIHAGGQDLTFPHHENEIAQSEAHNGERFANYWMHNGYINVNDEKMSKSLGNFILTRDLLAEHDPRVIRFFMLSVHYRNPINFSEALLEGAKNSLDRLDTAVFNLQHRREASMDLAGDVDAWVEKVATLKQRFDAAMSDDFNTANAISVLFDAAKEANVYLQSKQTCTAVIDSFLDLFATSMDVLGVGSAQSNTEHLLDADVEALIAERNEARKNRNFDRADAIRDQLKEQNIILEDTPQGVRWKRGQQ